MSYEDDSPSVTPQGYNPLAEAAVLGALIAAPATADAVWAVMTPEMFYNPQHAVLGSILLRMHNDAADITPATVTTRVAATGKLTQFGNGTYITDLFGSAYGVDQAATHAGNVRAAWLNREVVADAARFYQQARKPDADHTELAVTLAELVDKHTDLAAPPVAVGGQTILDVLDANYGPHVALIPGLLWRGNRYLYTGGEGLGKSEYAAQIASCAVSGLHPFFGEDFRPLTVQIIDAENDGRQAQKRYRRIVPLVDKLAPHTVDWSRLYIENRVDRWSLLKPADVAWVRQILDASRPDILVIGSLYKLYRGANVNDESAAGEVTAVFDELRARYGCALVIEGHMGKAKDASGRREGSVRGSSAFMGWPEFGHALQRAEEDPGEKFVTLADVVRFRGDREEDATWPEHIRRGQSGELPWVEATPMDLERFRFMNKPTASGF
jgi:hypothetical protein